MTILGGMGAETRPRTIGTPWLGERRGYLADWVTQRWVEATGRRVDLAEHPWLDSPVGAARGIGGDFFDAWAGRSGLSPRRDGGVAGLLPDFAALRSRTFDPASVHGDVVDFYQCTSAYELDAWSHWSGWFQPFGRLLALLFSRRLQQLNVPLTGLDTSRGMSSEVLPLVDPLTGAVAMTAWIRRLTGTGHIIYAGSYCATAIPGWDGPCVKVGFPLPNGNALVFMRPDPDGDDSLRIVSSGRRFGDPGFYFTLAAGEGQVVARYVPSFRESIHVYATDAGLRADHVLSIWGRRFLEIHYRMRRRPVERPAAAS